MRYAYCINGFEDFNANIDLACVAEQAGWDGFFLPDGLALEVPGYGPMPLFDPWVLMGAIAIRTTRIRFGAMITPISRRRPWWVEGDMGSLSFEKLRERLRRGPPA